MAGYTLIDALCAMTVLCILAGISIPNVLSGVDRSRGLAAARFLAARMGLARAQAVSRSAVVALQFEEKPGGVWFSVVQDGNGDGVRTSDIGLQIDRPIDGPVLLSQLFPGASIGLTPQTPATQAVQLGGTMILSFTPTGTATSGTVHVRGRDGTQWAVRVAGVTARVRLLRYDPASGTWINAD